MLLERGRVLRQPNTLCVEHLQAVTLKANRDLQTRRTFVHLQVGLVDYEDVFGPPDEAQETIPYYIEPEWLRASTCAMHPA